MTYPGTLHDQSPQKFTSWASTSRKHPIKANESLTSGHPSLSPTSFDVLLSEPEYAVPKLKFELVPLIHMTANT